MGVVSTNDPQFGTPFGKYNRVNKHVVVLYPITILGIKRLHL